METILQQEWFTLFGIPLLICLAKICDVTLGTIRIIFVSKGLKYLAPLLGFFEITIWILAIGEVMKNVDNIVNVLAYAIGFSLGNLVGIIIEKRLAIGMVVMRIITKRDSAELVHFLRKRGYNVTVVDAEGNLGHVSVIFLSLKRSRVNEIVPSIFHYNPLASYTIEDLRYVNDPNINEHNLPRKSKYSIFRPKK